MAYWDEAMTHNHDEALAAYRMPLARTPRGPRTLEGFARAAEAAEHGALDDPLETRSAGR